LILLCKSRAERAHLAPFPSLFILFTAYEDTALFLLLLLVHVPIVVPVGRHAACLALAAYTVSYAQVQETLYHYSERLLASLVPSALRYNLHSRAAGHHVVLQRVSAEL